MTATRPRWTAYLLVLSITLGHLTGAAHLASTAHELCPEHGVMEDVATVDVVAASPRDEHRHCGSGHEERPLVQAPAGHGSHRPPHSHDGCSIVLLVPSVADFTLTVGSVAAPAPTLRPAEPEAPTALSIPRFRLAPKGSPPLSA